MTQYNKFVIYKIFQEEFPDIFYIGSTANFSQRKSNHKKNHNNKSSKKYNYPLYQYIRKTGGWINGKWNMIVYEEYPCEDKKQGLTKEQEIIDLLKPKLNCNKSIKINLKLNE
jgi:hypothetical protein